MGELTRAVPVDAQPKRYRLVDPCGNHVTVGEAMP